MLHLVRRPVAFLIAGIALTLTIATGADERRAALGEHKIVDLARTRVASILVGAGGSSHLGGGGGSDFVRRARPLAVGDFNGDGFQDIAVGAPETNARAGAAYIFFGKGGGQFSQQPDAEMAGAAQGDELGFALAATDIDGDGIDDLLVGAPGASSTNREESGALFILAGSVSLGGTIDLKSASRIIYGPESSSRFGSSIAATRAQEYILVGAPRSHSGSGAAYIIQRSALVGSVDAAAESASVVMGAPASELGTAVVMADLNADGSADFVLGAPFAANLSSDPEAGAVYVIFSRQDLSLSFDVGAGQCDATIYGAGPGDHFGASLCAGDITADGAAELIVGAPDRSALGRAGAGQVYVIRVRSDFSGGVDELAPLAIYGAQGDHLGATVALGSASGDETADLLLGAPGALDGKGSVSIIFGGVNLLGLPERDLALGQDDLRILGAERGEGSGWAIATINANGKLLAISAPLARAPQSDAQSGKLYILPAQENRPPSVQLSAPNGGETIRMGQFFDIRWSASDPDGNDTLTRVDIFLSLDGGDNFPIRIASNLPGSTSSFKWQVLLTATTLRARVRVVVTDNAGAQAFDDSDANFIIVDEGVPVRLLSPNGGEQISSTQSVTIRWDVAFADRIRLGGFDLYYSTDGGATFSHTIALNLGPNTFSFSWQPPPVCASRSRVLVVAFTQSGATTSDSSDADFTVFNPGPTIDAGRMLLNDEMSRLVLFTIAPSGGVEVLFNSGTLVEISKDEAGTQFATFDKTPKVKRGGRKLITRGLIDGKDLLEFFPIGEVRVLKVTNPSCGITKMTVRRFGFQLFPLSP
jgi:hypothetical protein